ncbi:MAG: hypothetical protein JST55_08515 [Bacteroidetes bacterium]|nr:hypothetical protein [Bacteroidota bacterium]
MSDFKLVAIKCKSCDSGLVVSLNDNITYCQSCGSGWEIIDGELHPIEINFAAAAMRGDGELVYKPFWLVTANINILERESSGGFFSNLFGGSKEQTSGTIKFYIPAFTCELEKMKNLALAFTSSNPVASPQKFNTRLVGFNYGKEDAKKLAEFLLITIEAEKSDTIKTFRYDMNFEKLEILGIPFYRLPNNKMKDALMGIEI